VNATESLHLFLSDYENITVHPKPKKKVNEKIKIKLSGYENVGQKWEEYKDVAKEERRKKRSNLSSHITVTEIVRS
jgi:hypothetical protein